MLPGLCVPLMISKKTLTLETVQSLPAMTSDTAPSGVITYSTQNDNSSWAGWSAFDKKTDTVWGSQYDLSLPQYIQRQTVSPIIVGRFGVGFRLTGGAGGIQRSPKDFKLSGSNDDINFVDLRVITGETTWLTSGYQEKYYDIPSPTPFNRHRLTVSGVNGSELFVTVHELILLQLL